MELEHLQIVTLRKGEVVIKWDLKSLSNEEYDNLSEYERK